MNYCEVFPMLIFGFSTIQVFLYKISKAIFLCEQASFIYQMAFSKSLKGQTEVASPISKHVHREQRYKGLQNHVGFQTKLPFLRTFKLLFAIMYLSNFLMRAFVQNVANVCFPQSRGKEVPNQIFEQFAGVQKPLGVTFQFSHFRSVPNLPFYFFLLLQERVPTSNILGTTPNNL